MTTQAKRIFVIGGTGAQGIPVITALVKDKKYHCRVLTRDPTSARAQALVALGNVDLVEGTYASEADLRKGYRGCEGAFAIRSYEIALEEGIRFFVYGNLDYGYKKGGYDPKFRCGHYDGKGRVGEWILAQNQQNSSRMGAALFTTGPYMEMSIAKGTPMTPTVEEGGVVTWKVPLGQGAVPHVALDDCGYYVPWLFDHQDRANGLDLAVAIDHIDYHELARAFEKVTGHPARYVDIDLDAYWESGPLSKAASQGAGYNTDSRDPASMTVRQNFTGFWNLWKHSGGNKGVVRRDYKLLDEIHPNRIRTAEEWFIKETEKGIAAGKGSLWDRVQPDKLKPVLKIAEDGRRGRL
ncbi:hypothetical protein VTN77DRAFT_3292 [Rasamsonia byssochlamydoides]|uniref:uncharacterized protein n=1 Tax=Rasamsonia byssochlamydoides TaxID=89139 RepID=UPI00374211FD